MNLSISPEQKKQIVMILITLIIAALVQIAAVFGVVVPVINNAMTQNQTQAQSIGALGVGVQPAQSFRALVVSNSIEDRGTLSVTGASTFTGAVTTSATLSAGTFMVLTPGTAITVTNGTPFTPTASAQPIQAAGTVTPTLSVTNSAGAAYAAGTMLRVINVSNQTINLADSGNVKLSTAWAGGQYDTLTLLFDGTTSTWIEIARSDN
jgi:hypothetical protein